jgi:hypothetical protein
MKSSPVLILDKISVKFKLLVTLLSLLTILSRYYFFQIMILRRRLATPQQSHKMVLRERTSAPNSPCMFSPKLKHLSPASLKCHSPASLKRPSPTEGDEGGATPSKMIRPWIETPKSSQSRQSSTPIRQGTVVTRIKSPSEYWMPKIHLAEQYFVASKLV